MKITFEFSVANYHFSFSAERLDLDAIKLSIDRNEKQLVASLLAMFQDNDCDPIARIMYIDDEQVTSIWIDDGGWRKSLLGAESAPIMQRRFSILAKMYPERAQEFNELVQTINVLHQELNAIQQQYLLLGADFLANLTQGTLFVAKFLKDFTASDAGIIQNKVKLGECKERLKTGLAALERDYPGIADAPSFAVEIPSKEEPKALIIALFKKALRAQINALEIKIVETDSSYYQAEIQRFQEQLRPLFIATIAEPGLTELLNELSRVVIHTDASSCFSELLAQHAQLNELRKVFVSMMKYQPIDSKQLGRLIDLARDPGRFKQFIAAFKYMENTDTLTLEVVAGFLAEERVVDKSCMPRVKTPYLFWGRNVTRNKEEYAYLWSLYSMGIEQALVRRIKSGLSLKELLSFAQISRRGLAVFRDESQKEAFGLRRPGISMRDTYASEGKSIIDPELFITVKKIIGATPKYLTPIKEALSSATGDEVACKLTQQLSLQIGQTTINFPLETMKITLRQDGHSNYDPVSLQLSFSALDEEVFTQVLEHAQEHFLTPCTEKKFNDEAFVAELGKLVFYLARLYPYQRGSGAILQWLTRSLVSYHTNGEVNLGDIRLGSDGGSDQGLPYDVYAHLIQDVEAYVEAFKHELLPRLEARQQMVFRIS